jgi:hypothetical protein
MNEYCWLLKNLTHLIKSAGSILFSRKNSCLRTQKSGRHGPAALECFFGDIPAASELNPPSFNERKAERNKLIQNKAKKMIEEYNKTANSPQ